MEEAFDKSISTLRNEILMSPMVVTPVLYLVSDLEM
jgi:hypothetical protein